MEDRLNEQLKKEQEEVEDGWNIEDPISEDLIIEETEDRQSENEKEQTQGWGEPWGEWEENPSTHQNKKVFSSETNIFQQKPIKGAKRPEGKSFHRLQEDDSKVWVIPSSTSSFKEEYESLRKIAEGGCPTVLAGEAEEVIEEGKTRDAYPMEWIENGISSKSHSRDFQKFFENCTDQQRGNALESFEKFERLHEESGIEVADFQVILDPKTGHMYANDPMFAANKNEFHDTNRKNAIPLSTWLTKYESCMKPAMKKEKEEGYQNQSWMQTQQPRPSSEYENNNNQGNRDGFNFN